MAIHMHANFLVLKNVCEYREKYSCKVPSIISWQSKSEVDPKKV